MSCQIPWDNYLIDQIFQRMKMVLHIEYVNLRDIQLSLIVSLELLNL